MKALKGNVRTTHRFPTRQKLCVALVLAMAACASPAWAQRSDAPQAYSISSGNLADALDQLSAQSKVQIIYPADLVRGKRASAVSGQQTWRQALEKLLAGSGLEWSQINEGTVAIRKAEIAPKPAAVRKPAQVQTAPQTKEEAVTELETMVVTGTHLRGVSSAGSPLIELGQDYFEQTGYATLEDVLRTLPQAAPGPNAFDPLAGMRSGSLYRNWGGGAGVNLRGLGADSTLVLVDGQRQAGSGTGGSFVNIAAIPLSAVERIQIVPDGASAIYGSDAVGGVVNVILKKDFDGFESRVSLGTLDGDSNEFRASQAWGKTWASGNLFAGIEYYKREVLLASDRPYSQDSDQRANGGDNFSSLNPQANPGNILCSAFGGSCTFFQPVFAIPTGQDGTNLQPGDLIPVGPNQEGANLHNLNSGTMLVPEMIKKSAYVNFSQKVTAKSQLSGSIRYSEMPISYSLSSAGYTFQVPSTNPYYVDAFGDGQPYYIAYSYGDDLPLRVNGKTKNWSASLTGKMDFGREWQARLGVSYGRESTRYRMDDIDTSLLEQAVGNPSWSGTTDYDPETQGYFNPYVGGSSSSNLAILRSFIIPSTEGNTWDTVDGTLTVDGPIASVPGGKIRAAFGVGYRHEGGESGASTFRVGNLAESVQSAFAEMQIPFYSAANGRPGLRELSASVAARYENYLGYQSTLNPKVGLVWSPLEPLSLRATWGTSFRAPSPADRNESVFNLRSATIIPSVADPGSASGRSTVLYVGGGINPDLHEERSKNWSAGFDLHLGGVEAPFRLGLTYYDIRYTDKIGRAGSGLQVLQNEAAYRDIIIRNPPPALIESLCQPPGGPSLENCLASNPTVIIDFRLRNIAHQVNRGIDLQIEKSITTSTGRFGGTLNLNRVLKNEIAVSETSAPLDYRDEPGAPLRLKARGTLYWEGQDWSGDVSVNYAPDYTDPLSGLTYTPRSVSSWTTMDFGVHYRPSTFSGWLSDTTFSFKVVNILDRNPPYLNDSYGYDRANANPYGRMMTFEITKGW